MDLYNVFQKWSGIMLEVLNLDESAPCLNLLHRSMECISARIFGSFEAARYFCEDSG